MDHATVCRSEEKKTSEGRVDFVALTAEGYLWYKHDDPQLRVDWLEDTERREIQDLQHSDFVRLLEV